MQLNLILGTREYEVALARKEKEGTIKKDPENVVDAAYSSDIWRFF